MSKRRKFSPEFKSQVVAAAPQAFEKGNDSSGEEERIAELERMVGRLTMELEIAKKASHLLSGMGDKNGRQR